MNLVFNSKFNYASVGSEQINRFSRGGSYMKKLLVRGGIVATILAVSSIGFQPVTTNAASVSGTETQQFADAESYQKPDPVQFEKEYNAADVEEGEWVELGTIKGNEDTEGIQPLASDDWIGPDSYRGNTKFETMTNKAVVAGLGGLAIWAFGGPGAAALSPAATSIITENMKVTYYADKQWARMAGGVMQTKHQLKIYKDSSYSKAVDSFTLYEVDKGGPI